MPKITIKHTATFDSADKSMTEIFAAASENFILEGTKRKQLTVNQVGPSMMRVHSEFLAEYEKDQSGDEVKLHTKNNSHQFFVIEGCTKLDEKLAMRRKSEIRRRKKKKVAKVS